MRRAGELLRRGAAFLTVLWPTVGVPALALASLVRRGRPPAGSCAAGGSRGDRCWRWASSTRSADPAAPRPRRGPARPRGGLDRRGRAVRALPAPAGGAGGGGGGARGRGGRRHLDLAPDRRQRRRSRAARRHLREPAARRPEALRAGLAGPRPRRPDPRLAGAAQRRGPSGWSWYTYDPGFVVEPLPSGPDGYARITPPAHGGSYVTRRIDTHAALAGRTFRARLRLRAAEPFEAAAPACRGVLLREVGGTSATACFPLALGTEWSDHEFTWDVPATATSSLIRIELRIGTASFEVGDVELEEAVADGWRSFGAARAGRRPAHRRPPRGGADRLDHRGGAADPDWQRVTVRLDDPRIAPGRRPPPHRSPRGADRHRGPRHRRPSRDRRRRGDGASDPAAAPAAAQRLVRPPQPGGPRPRARGSAHGGVGAHRRRPPRPRRQRRDPPPQAQGFTNLITRTRAELDLRDPHAVDAFFAAERPHYVVLAAAKVGGILANATYPADFLHQNLMIAANVIDAAHRTTSPSSSTSAAPASTPSTPPNPCARTPSSPAPSRAPTAPTPSPRSPPSNSATPTAPSTAAPSSAPCPPTSTDPATTSTCRPATCCPP
jgi:hypothetical protein